MMILLNLAFRPRGALFLWCKWIRADMFCIFLSLTFGKPHNFNTEAARRPFLRPVFMHLRSFLCAHISTCAARPATNAHVRAPRCVPPEARRCAVRNSIEPHAPAEHHAHGDERPSRHGQVSFFTDELNLRCPQRPAMNAGGPTPRRPPFAPTGVYPARIPPSCHAPAP